MTFLPLWSRLSLAIGYSLSTDKQNMERFTDATGMERARIDHPCGDANGWQIIIIVKEYYFLASGPVLIPGTFSRRYCLEARQVC